MLEIQTLDRNSIFANIHTRFLRSDEGWLVHKGCRAAALPEI
jgi:hypothetical protein